MRQVVALLSSETCLNVLSVVIGLLIVTIATLYYAAGRTRCAALTVAVGLPVMLAAELTLDEFYKKKNASGGGGAAPPIP